ncbi:MAG TPA: LPXTG cell wall anchor domain-containing protein, partial [Anaerolineae bacterium]|nr:LPXTG cell wall anchor domain-containing protein [Anaerolineae bacterium]
TAVATVDPTEGAAGIIEIGEANTPTPTPLPSVDAGKDSSLPQTGLETWGIIALGAILVIVLLGARRLRAS